MNKIYEKYKDQLLQTKVNESKETITKLKTDSDFKKQTAYKLLDIAYRCGYDILNESGKARYIEFHTDIKNNKTYDYTLDKIAYTYSFTKEYNLQDRNIFISKRLYNWKTYESWVNEKFPIDIEKAILHHTFAYDLCQKRIDKHFKKFKTDVSDKGQKNAFLINKTIGFSLRPKSNVYVIDIDCNGTPEEKDKADNTLRKLIDIHTPEAIIFIERSYSGAYHIAIRFGDKEGITEAEFSDYVKCINEIHFSTNQYSKLDTVKNGLRFLFSSTYYPINWDCKYPTFLGELYNSLFDAIDDFNARYNESINKYFTYVKKEKVEIIENTIAEPKEKVFLKNSAIYGSRNNPKGFKQIRITKGNRFKTQAILVPYLKAKGLTKEEVWDYLLSVDDGCKARIENPDKWQKEVFAFYDKSRATFNSHTNNSEHVVPNQYRSQSKHIPQNIKYLIEDEKLIKSIIYFTRYKYTKRNIAIFKIVLTEMLGTFYYDTINVKQLKPDQNPKFLIGSQFSQTMCNLLKQYYPELKRIAVYKLVRKILHYSGLFKLYNPFNSTYCRSWVFFKKNNENNKCNQWLLNNNLTMEYTTINLSSIILTVLNSYIKSIYKIFINYSNLKNIFNHFNILNLFLNFDDELDERLDRLLTQSEFIT
jgi:hypothetical protein